MIPVRFRKMSWYLIMPPCAENAAAMAFHPVWRYICVPRSFLLGSRLIYPRESDEMPISSQERVIHACTLRTNKEPLKTERTQSQASDLGNIVDKNPKLPPPRLLLTTEKKRRFNPSCDMPTSWRQSRSALATMQPPRA